MSKNEVRLSQLVGLFGPGAMVDLPDRSVIIGGLERWEMREGGWKVIDEPRLSLKLQSLLQQRSEIELEHILTLRTPPLPPKTHSIPPGVAATVFPTWFVSEQVEPFTSGGREGRGRQLVHWRRLDAAGARKTYVSQQTGKKVSVTPIRFVGACPSGHLQDLNWNGIVHADGPKCGQPLWLEEQGTSGDPRDVTIACECGRSISLVQASAPGRLGKCRGSSPWLGGDEEGCAKEHDVSLLIRTATNTYFPQVATVISLPEAESEVGRLVQAHMSHLAKAETVQDIATLRRLVDPFNAAFEGYRDDEVLAALNQIREGAAADGQAPIKVAEFDRLAQGDPQIGRNEPNSRFYAETLPRSAWDDGGSSGRFIRNVVAVHRLREVSALYGFTRLEPAPTQDDGELEDIRLAVEGAPLAKETSWLPAIEQLGEGLFLHFDERHIQSWMSRPDVQERASIIQAAHDRWWSERKAAEAPPAPGIAYVLLHTLSHALLTQIALDCGYPASSLKERIYSISGTRGGAPTRCGILIYTASPGAQGSLGGLAGIASRILPILDQALESQLICSSDPVCADHAPGDGGGDRSLLGAACHGCQLIAETSCEARNLYLDRSLIVPTMAARSLPLFSGGA